MNTTAPNDLTLRPASDQDSSLVDHLEEVCMRDYATALWGQWLPRPEGPFPADQHRIIVHSGIDVGCVETIRQPDHLWLNKFYLLPAYQRRGIGAIILKRMVDEAAALGLPLRLSVLTTNPAQAFYRREGFREIKRDQERVRFEAGNV